jgi:nucleoid DNA-binding protein
LRYAQGCRWSSEALPTDVQVASRPCTPAVRCTVQRETQRTAFVLCAVHLPFSGSGVHQLRISSGELNQMNTRQTVAEIARRLPDLRRRDVVEMFEVLAELWCVELAKPDGEIHIAGLGRLYVETHDLKATGVIRQRLIEKYGQDAPQTVQRRVIRFRPSEALHTAMKQEVEAYE